MTASTEDERQGHAPNVNHSSSLAPLTQHLGHGVVAEALADFTTTFRVVPLSCIAIGIGVLGAIIAVLLLGLINFFTNLFFYQQLSTAPVSPAGNHLGLFVVVAPIIGGLIIGLMARYGSERIRGHGIPEAIEAILMNRSRVEPRVAILKPLSSAISIGSGGPFGAEGPIIMTGGAFGSLVAQFLHVTSAERRTLLVAGAAAGMSAVFATPVAAVLLAVELLLFEWKPRSLIPVALASAAAATLRHYLLGPAPLFPTPPHPEFIGVDGLLACALVGLVAGVIAGGLTMSVYSTEDAFQRLPIHWMWWPAIGGLAIGIGGLIVPDVLGIGYDTIGALLRGESPGQAILVLLIVKWLIWAIALGSGTSGGILAPLLMIGGAVGGLEAGILPNEGLGFWPLISMSAVLGGTMRSPFTAIIFALELTHDFNALLPLLIAVTVAHGFTVLTMRRSILTEKLSRRGYHLIREYAPSPLEVLFVREVMRTSIAILPERTTPQELEETLHHYRSQRLFPIVNGHGQMIGVMTRNDARSFLASRPPAEQPLSLADWTRPNPVVVYPDESLRMVLDRMAETKLTRFPVVQRGASQQPIGLISLNDLLTARIAALESERRRERLLRFPGVVPRVRSPQTKG